MDREEAKLKLGGRAQRCSGCYAAFYLKDMWLGPEATYFCENCRDDTMFPFEQFTGELKLAELQAMVDEEGELTQCQNPFNRQA
jgi:hypothetical protein